MSRGDPPPWTVLAFVFAVGALAVALATAPWP